MKKILSALLLLSAAYNAQATIYISNFSGGSPGDPANGVDGWVQSEVDNSPASPKSFRANVTASILPGLGIGAFYDVPGTDPLVLSRASINVPQVNLTTLSAQFKTKFALTDSSGFLFRNTFSLTLKDSLDVSIASVVFTPNTQIFPPVGPVDDQWLVTINGGPTVAGVFGGGDYNLSVIFDNYGFYKVRISDHATDTDVYQSASILSTNTNNIAEIELGYAQGPGAEWGDNIFGIAGTSVIPEPSSALLVGLSTLGLLRRKRVQA